MSSRSESKTASQLVSLTMKLKYKLHPQRPKPGPAPRTGSEPAALDHQPQVLVDQQRAVISSLQYFKALVDRLGLDRVPARPGGGVLNQAAVGSLVGGACEGVLEAAQVLVQLEPRLLLSGSVSGCLSRFHRSLAQLVLWADRLLLQGVSHDDGRPAVTTAIRAVLDSVKELGRLAKERTDGSAPLSPVQSEGFDGLETDGVPAANQVPAPPKPPMPLLEAVHSPPALPPKRRQPPSLPVPAPCRVTIVTPLAQEPEEDTPPNQEPADGLKRLSASSADSHCEEDPDYDFLHEDLSSVETLPPQIPPQMPPHMPPLPEKRRRSSAGVFASQSSSPFGFDSAPVVLSPAPCPDAIGPDGPLSPSKTPPPLPEKKRHIQQYLQICGSYSDQQAVQYYQRQLAQLRLDPPASPPAPPRPPRPRSTTQEEAAGSC
ncbi:rap guanine nucleotide exchange factor 1-like [Menidia menidia]